MAASSLENPNPSPPKLGLLPLVALIFFDVSGGPFGVEPSVSAGGGPLLALAGFLLFPLLWSLPEALLTAELSSAFPSNGGYVLWISSAFPTLPALTLATGFLKWTSGTIDNALYPILFLDYFPFLPRPPFAFLTTAVLTFLNYRGLHIVGLSAVLLTAFSLSPFVVMSLLSVPKLRPARWLEMRVENVNLSNYFNCMFWNLNYWDKASTLAGEVEDPGRTFPKAVFGAVVLVVGSYLVPLLAGTGATEAGSDGQWTDGFFAEVGAGIGGAWLGWWIRAAAAVSNVGLFEAEMSSDSFQLLGMSEMGMIPEIFSRRSKYGTPTISILCSATGVIILSWMSFQEILEILNFLYALGMLIEFAAFVKLRIRKPDLRRPYKVPVGTFGAIVLCLPPTFLLILVMCLASVRTLAISVVVIILGSLLYPAMQYMKEKKWVRFIDTPLPAESFPEVLPTDCTEEVDEAYASLLPDPSSIQEGQHSEIGLEEVSKVE
ncbi:uncharacterized protein M6B38_303830 [Iris pallida]|uniref:Polyamine transporter PUT1 n=1 Tax=Iris pallida TaxID=29817 RepID=A0AAX6HNT1_IRIPA|nr:uncharacterized protein M6B38_303830 [Iris pallida]